MVFHKVSSQIFDSTNQNLTEGGGNHIPPPLTIQQPIPLEGTLLTWSKIELEGAAVHWLQAPGVRPSTLGSSGTFWRNLSSFSLNYSTVTFVLSLTDFGTALNN